MMFALPIIALLASAVLVALAKLLAQRTFFMDRPGSQPHKQQASAVPYGGGIGIALAFVFCVVGGWYCLPAEDGGLQRIRALGIPLTALLGATLLFGLGLWDDLRHLSARLKMVIQAVVCAGTVWTAQLDIDSFQHIPVLSYGLAIAWLLLITNVYNLLDHADGLCASVALVSCCVLVIGSLGANDSIMAVMWLALIGSLAGFLIWNLPPARIYMGDCGALPLGFLIGVGTLSVTFWPSAEGGSPLAVLSPLLITAIPLFDTTVVVIKRIRRRKNVFVGDRNHISHRLRRLGMGPLGSLATVVALQIAIAAGTLQLRESEWTPGLVVLAQVAAIILVVVLLETTRDAND